MRVTNRASTRNYLRYVNKGLSDQAKTQEKVASGNRFEKVSDDVSSGIKAMKARSDQYKMEKQIGNIEDINNVLVAAEDSMQSIDDQLKTVYTRFLRAMNDTNQNNRNIFAAEIKALKEEILQLANSKYNDQFLFSGSNNYDAPFSVDKETGHLVYNGIGVPTDKIFQREDGTYYYETIQYDEKGQPITKNVPQTNENGYLFEGGPTKTPPENIKINANGKLPNGNTVTKVTEGVYSDTTIPTDIYIKNPQNTADGYLKIDTTSTALSLTPGTNPGDLSSIGTAPVVDRGSGVYEAEDGTMYVQYPAGTGSFYAAAASTTATENQGANCTLSTGDPLTMTDANGTQVEVTQTGPDTYETKEGTLFVKNEWGTGFKQVTDTPDPDDPTKKLQQNVPAYKDVPLNDEIYLDVGLGIRMNGSTVDPQTAFNVSYCGPEILGFGINEENGLSNNIYNLLNDMEDMLKNPDKYSVDSAQAYGNQLLDRLDAFRENITDLGAKTQFLETMLDRLNKSRDNLEISIGNYTGTDYVEESRHQASASAVINALYQLGSNIIPLSLMDFVK